jgi:DNA-binding response OmpR family regulator
VHLHYWETPQMDLGALRRIGHADLEQWAYTSERISDHAAPDSFGAAMFTKKLLIVDDDADIRDLLAYRFRRLHYDVIVAVDGVAALEAVEDVTPDVVLVDWMMPRMSGVEVCHELRSRPAFARTGIFLITANCDAAHRRQGLAAGATGYIDKPFSISAIVARVDNYLLSSAADGSVPQAS